LHLSATNCKNCAHIFPGSDFRENRDLSGEKLDKALWLGQMELQRLQTWVPTSKDLSAGKDFDVKL